MDIAVSGRHFNITEEMKQRVIDTVTAQFAELPLKIISAHVVLDLQGSRAIADVVVNVKNNLTAKALVEDYDLYKAIDAAVLKAATQARKYLDKRKHHKNGETLVSLDRKREEGDDAVRVNG
ncbi:MAG: ribosome hibernation promoting factor HPF [Lentisphaerae bacterium ADurb.Bin242]|nr:MAG: ribosome hibernation promoting factor HPF [Lentisphaerae bacterium ADurb.Bin242]